jgi:hypothetical protein
MPVKLHYPCSIKEAIQKKFVDKLSKSFFFLLKKETWIYKSPHDFTKYTQNRKSEKKIDTQN